LKAVTILGDTTKESNNAKALSGALRFSGLFLSAPGINI